MQAIPMPNLENLRRWFKAEAREFPWRISPTPYKVWISEVMLQQTQASVVAAYFERWMIQLPTIEALASAPLEKVMKLWEGLGYYARVRHLHEAARYIVSHFQAELPKTEEELAQIKGLGPYTIGAIRSFAFHEKAAAVDGNVARVLSRLLLIEEEIDQPRVQKKMRVELLQLLPDFEPWVIMEALIELGARICTKNPHCMSCPLQDGCIAFRRGKQQELPNRSKRPKSLFIHRTVAIIFHQRQFLLRQERQKKIMQGLYEFPYLEGQDADFTSIFPFSLQFEKKLPDVEHSFTRYHARLFPSIWRANRCEEVEGYIWVSSKELIDLPFSAGHRQIFKLLDSYLD